MAQTISAWRNLTEVGNNDSTDDENDHEDENKGETRPNIRWNSEMKYCDVIPTYKQTIYTEPQKNIEADMWDVYNFDRR